MKHRPASQRSFLFLQGPPGPFFWLLAQGLKQHGAEIHRINMNGGDQADWPGTATNYRGRLRRWSLFIDRYLREHDITDLVLFGDCRPMHMAAHRMATLRKIAVHVFEEGYIRPDWVTLERDGVNGHSSLSRDPFWYLERAKLLPPLPDRPTITASFQRRARDTFRYFAHMILRSATFPFYASHRQGSVLLEGLGWARKLVRRKRLEAEAEEVTRTLVKGSYFLFPLQLSNDYQIRAHAPFADMVEALDYVLISFARRAPRDAKLVIKEHPLDPGLIDWRRVIERRARELDLGSRLIHIAGGDLTTLSTNAAGMVTVNSTSATLALQAGVPTMALGKAIYSMPGITCQGRLDDFWLHPMPPRTDVFDAFRRVLHDRCLVYGGFASKSAIETLIEGCLDRLIGVNSTSQSNLAEPDLREAAE